KKLRRIMFGGLMVRTVEPFDWEKEIRTWWPKFTEVRAEGQVYYKVEDAPHLGKDACFYLPDDRTLVLNVEEDLVRLIHRKGPPESFRGMRWDQLDGSLLVFALNNRDGRLAPILDKGEPEDIELAPLF